MNRLSCDVCNVRIHKPYYVRHLSSKKHLKNIPDCSREDVENKLYKVLSLRQLAREHNNYFH